MSDDEQFAPRSRRDRPRYDTGDGLKYPDDDDVKSAPRHPRYETSPLPGDPREEPRHKRDTDPRIEMRDNTDEKSSKSNTAAPRRRRSFDDDEDAPPRYPGKGDDQGYGRSKGYRQPLPPPEADRDEPKRSSKRRDYDDDFDPVPPRRANTHREPDRRRRDDLYDDEAPKPRRRPSPGYRDSDRDRGYRSDDKDRRRRDDDRYDDRRYRGGGGYASDRGGHGRSDRDRRDRDRDSGRDNRDRDRDRVRDSDRDRRRYDSDRDRDRHRNDRDRDRDRDRYDSRDRDRRSDKKKGGFDINELVNQGQKHYKTVAPIIGQLTKMYMDQKK